MNVGSNPVFVTHNVNKVAGSDVKATDIPLQSNQSKLQLSKACSPKPKSHLHFNHRQSLFFSTMSEIEYRKEKKRKEKNRKDRQGELSKK